MEDKPTVMSDVTNAPFIFFENAPAFGCTNGVINITLSASRAWVVQDGSVVTDQVVVAFLRGNVQAAIDLRKAIDSALLMAAPAGDPQ
jgi:hypothetical protein